MFIVARYTLLVIIYICIGLLPASSQTNVFNPSIEDVNQLTVLFAKYEQRYQEEVTAFPKENKKDFENLYKERWDNVKEVFDKKEIYTNAGAQQYLDALVAEIVKNNPELQKEDIHCYFSRSGVPNASYIGEGIILFNMGLFKKLANESQAAFVLCHELSHFYLKHSENSIRKYVATINSKEMQDQLHKIKHNEYGKRQRVEDLLKGITFDFRRHGRDHESQADSMAIEFMHRTKYDVSESLTALALLDSIDNDTLDVAKCLQNTFNAKDYPFQKRWIAKEDGLLGGHGVLDEDTTLADSLKTHPDCKIRIQILEPLVNKYMAAAMQKNVIDSVRFKYLKNIFAYEIVEYSFETDHYTQCLYYTLELLQSWPHDPYLVTRVGKIFNGFYAAQKNHTLGRVIELPSPYFHPNYNLLLQFVQNLYLENFVSISYYYLNPFVPLLSFYAPFNTTYNTSKKIVEL